MYKTVYLVFIIFRTFSTQVTLRFFCCFFPFHFIRIFTFLEYETYNEKIEVIFFVDR